MAYLQPMGGWAVREGGSREKPISGSASRFEKEKRDLGARFELLSTIESIPNQVRVGPGKERGLSRAILIAVVLHSALRYVLAA